MAEKLLKLIGPLHIVVGLILYVSYFSPSLSSMLVEAFELPVDNSLAPFLVAVFGPTISSWGVLFTVVAYRYFRSPSRDLWWSMIVALVVWAPFDTFLCIQFGLTKAVMLNLVVLVAFLILLGLVRKESDQEN